jgi:ribosomal protein L18E
MPEKQTTESDEARLQKKIAERLAQQSNPEGNAAMRLLRKRLKREQRRRRSLALRKKHAGGGKPADAPAPAAG